MLYNKYIFVAQLLIYFFKFTKIKTDINIALFIINYYLCGIKYFV